VADDYGEPALFATLKIQFLHRSDVFRIDLMLPS